MGTEHIRSLAASFRYAGKGVWHCIRRERNFRIHLVAAVYAFALAWWIGLTREGWAALLLVISFVLSREMTNTAVEALVDLATDRRHPLAAIAKDTAAGAVLISAIASVAIGVLLFWHPQRLYALAALLQAQPGWIALLALSAAVSVWFVFMFGDKPKQIVKE